MRLIKLHSSLRQTFTSALFAGLWVLELRAHEKVEAKLRQLEADLEQYIQNGASLVAENSRLIELDRIRSKFVADAAHDLRTPLTSLNLRLYMLEHAPAEKRGQYIAEFKQQLNHLNDLTDDLLMLAKLDSFELPLHFVPVNLNTVAEEVIIAYRPVAESVGISLVSEYAPNLTPVIGEHRQLVRMGSNLVANALHYTPSGRVRLATFLDTKQKQVCLEVEDTGSGIDPHDLPHLFDRFYRGQKQHVNGTGLGLSIVKEIVDLHNGSIEVQSYPGEGSIFKVCFPLMNSAAD
jgi:signal transduction histidine kinase